MGSILITLICLTIIEIYLFISIGSEIGAFTTISLIFLTAIIGVYYAKYEGLKTLKSGFIQLSKNEPVGYEILSGAGIAFAALLLIVPGFLTDLMGFVLIFPFTRKLLFKKISKRFDNKNDKQKKNFIEGEFEDIEDDNDKKL